MPPSLSVLFGLLVALVAAQPSFDASIDGQLAVSESAAVAPFDNATLAYELPYDASEMTVSLTANSALSYQLFLAASGALTTPLDYYSGSLTSVGSSTDIIFNLNCSEESLVQISILFTVRAFTSTGPYDTVTTAYLSKQCYVPGCPTGCGVGTCDYLRGRCDCPNPYFGPTCEVMLDVPMYVCPNDTFNITWSRPPADATRSDWIAVLNGTEAELLSADGFASSDTAQFFNWFYLVPLASGLTAPNGSRAQTVQAPGTYFVPYMTEDSYYTIAGRTFQVLDWGDCGFSSCGADDLCSEKGVCLNTTCGCDVGFHGPGCEWGCTDEMIITNDTLITDGTPQGIPYSRYLNCQWLIQAPADAIGISLDFQWFSILEGWDYLRVYASANPDPSLLLLSLSGGADDGEGATYPYTTMLLSFSSDYFAFLSDGFGLDARIIYPPQLTWIKYDSGVAIAFIVLNALASSLVICAAVVIIYRYRKMFTVSTNFIFCLFVIIGVVLGLSTQYTLIGKPTKGMCLARMWVPSLAFAIIFGSLSAKVFNAYRMYQKIAEGKSLQDDHRILLFVAAFVVLESGFLALWTGINPPLLSRQTDPSTDDDWLACNYRQVFWPAASLLLKFLLLIVTGAISWRTRLLMTNYAEAKYVGLTIYNVSLTLLIALPLIILLKRFHVALFVIWSITILSSCFLSFCLLFGRLLYYMFFPEKKPRKSSGGSTSSGQEMQG